ncbi:MAG: hypothetical protein NUW22_04870 [Acidobacteria bacterium]|nr:hypothetical protein [Acidobacteriota bacterium]
MTTAAQDEIVARVLKREGGVKDIGDGKGLTRFGQTPGWLTQFNLLAPTNAGEAADNYVAWLRRTRLDVVISDHADALSDAVIDWAVHSGHVTPIKALQRVLGAAPDGVMGPETARLLAAADRRVLAVGIIADRVEMIGRLISGKVSNARYAHGWARRMAEHIRALG